MYSFDVMRPLTSADPLWSKKRLNRTKLITADKIQSTARRFSPLLEVASNAVSNVVGFNAAPRLALVA
jgi:hypothetical protein